MHNLNFQRSNMVKLQLEHFGVQDVDVLSAFLHTTKESFVPEELKSFSYIDDVLQNDDDFFLPRSVVLAKAIEELNIFRECRLLNVGASFGYSTALFNFLGAKLVTLDKNPKLTEKVQSLFWESDIFFITGTHANGCQIKAPFDRIFVLQHFDETEALLNQLSENGILISITEKENILKLSKENGQIIKSTIEVF